MILDHATALERDAIAVRERQQLGHQRAAWQTHTDRFTGIRERLASAAQFLDWLSATAGADQPTFDVPIVAAAIRSVTELHDALLAHPSSVLEGNQAPDTASQVDALVKQMEEHARTAWADHLDRDEWVPSSLWTQFEDNENLRERVRELVQQDRDRKELTKLAFPTPAQQANYEQMRNRRAELVDDLPDMSNEEIKEFLVAADGPGVPLGQYSDAVEAWLEEHGLADRYVIRTRA